MGCLRRLLALTLCGGMLFALPARAAEEELSLGDVLDPETYTEVTATPEPTPVPDPNDPATLVPEEIRNVLDIAYNEWETLGGKTLSQSNKYTWWRCGKGCKFGWCGGFVTWCMLEGGIPMDELQDIPDQVGSVYHVKEASVGKLLKGYQQLGRTTQIPQPGYAVVYGVQKSANKTVHVGLVYDVQDLGDGIYRLTTIEGNVSNRVKMYIYDYNSNEEFATENMSKIPEEERTLEANVYTSYKLHTDNWYINTFLMSWVPEE